MKDLGNQLNKMSMDTDEGDDDTIFLSALSEAMQIATSMVTKEKGEPEKTATKLIPASNKLFVVSIDSILK